MQLRVKPPWPSPQLAFIAAAIALGSLSIRGVCFVAAGTTCIIGRELTLLRRLALRTAGSIHFQTVSKLSSLIVLRTCHFVSPLLCIIESG